MTPQSRNFLLPQYLKFQKLKKEMKILLVSEGNQGLENQASRVISQKNATIPSIFHYTIRRTKADIDLNYTKQAEEIHGIDK